MRPHSRAYADVNYPQAWGNCDRCNFTYLHSQLKIQYQWAGPRLQNIQLLVCASCLDQPNQQLRTIILPSDPVPIMNPRPEQYGVEVPSYMSPSTGSIFILEDGSYLVNMIRITPTPSSSGYVDG